MNIFFEQRPCLSQREMQQYIGQELSHAQQHELEAHLIGCPLCATAVEGYERLGNAPQAETEMSNIKQQLKPPPSPKLKARRLWLNRAAAAVLLLVGLFALLQYHSAKEPQRLFAQHFEAAAPDYISMRGVAFLNPLSGKPELQQALKFYQAADYEASIPHFDNYLQEQPEDERAQFLLANALLGAWQPQRAKALLLQLEGADALRPEIYWYLALAHVQLNELEAAATLLQQMDMPTPYRAKAEDLLRAIT